MAEIPEAGIHQTIDDARLQLAIYSATRRLIDHRAGAVGSDRLPDYQELRTRANEIKRHTIEHLDYYLEQFEANVVAHGGKVVYCRTGDEVSDFVLGLAKERGARLIVKSKSMTTEEVHFNERLERHQLETVETDLGEYILQLAHQRPYHIVAPALHMTRYDVAELFTKTLGVARETEPENQTKIARATLREKFLAADIGVTGANFLVADSGAVVVVENEGNARLSSSAPKIHIAVAGIEKMIPRAQDLAVFLDLLGRSATGQPMTVYTSFLSGPRREGEIDGPEEFYVVLLDNGRTKLLRDPEKRQSLYCIRCGACLNHCPVYRKIGGHNYPWVYSGPIGAIITPQFHGIGEAGWLPFASSLCGACAEVCPVKIEIPKLLLKLRAEVKQQEPGGAERVRLSDLGLAHGSSLGLCSASVDRQETSAGVAEGGSAGAMDQPARASAAGCEKFSRAMARKAGQVTARDEILRDIRAALGRAGDSIPAPLAPLAPPMLRNPQMDRNLYTSLFVQNLEKLAGKVFVVPDRAAVVPALRNLARGQERGGFERAVSCGVRGDRSRSSAVRIHRGRGSAPGLRDCGCRHHQRRLCSRCDGQPGNAFESTRGASSLAAAAGTCGDLSAVTHFGKSGRIVEPDSLAGRAIQFDGVHHRAEPHRGHRADSDSRRARTGRSLCCHRGGGQFMKLAALFVLLLCSSSAAFAQLFEAGASFGASVFNNAKIGDDVISSSPAADAKIRLTDGFRFGFRVTLNTYRFLGWEFGYAYSRTHLKLDGPPSSELGMAVHQPFGNGLFYFTPEGSRIRPFVAAGVQASNFVPPGSSVASGGGDTKFGFNYGFGVKAKVRENWLIRADFRQYETGKPFNLPNSSGRLFQNEISAGFAFAL